MEGMDFYRELRQKTSAWAKEKGKSYQYIEYLLLAPDFFYLLVRLMLDRRVPARAKFKIGLVVAYYISPLDIIPEAMLGPVGFSDDLVLAVWTINSLLKSVDRQVLLDNWPSQTDLLATAEKIVTVADQWIGKGAYQKLRSFFKTRVFKD
jgi:uncharacterized membrane protein YkvA (DUF1232 family)